MKKFEKISESIFQVLSLNEMSKYQGGRGTSSDCSVTTSQGSDCPDEYRQSADDDGNITCEDTVDCNGNEL